MAGKEKDHIREDLDRVTDGPRIIGQPGPTAKTLRGMIEFSDALAEAERVRLAKVLENRKLSN